MHTRYLHLIQDQKILRLAVILARTRFFFLPDLASNHDAGMTLTVVRFRILDFCLDLAKLDLVCARAHALKADLDDVAVLEPQRRLATRADALGTAQNGETC